MKISKTTVNKGDLIVRKWHLIDLSGKTLGRVCVEIASLLMGKNKVDFSYNRDEGDYVVALNAKDIKVTGNKLKEKIYYHHTPFSGHLKEITLGDLLKKDARKVISNGVYGMIPKNKLRDQRMTRLKIFVGSEHPYADKFSK